MKKNTLILFMLSIISGMLIFGKTVYADESNSTVTTQYVMYDELTTKGFKSKLHKLDNESSEDTIRFFTNHHTSI